MPPPGVSDNPVHEALYLIANLSVSKVPGKQPTLWKGWAHGGERAAWKPPARAHGEALAVYRAADLDWTSMSPAAMMTPGERTGRFHIGTDRLVTDNTGESRISAEDYAVALVDEVERPQFIRRRMTVAY